MSDKDTSEPAYPAPDAGAHDYGENNRGVYRGLTMRDYFAATALPAVIAAYIEANGRVIGAEHLPRNCPILAYQIADGMLEARK